MARKRIPVIALLFGTVALIAVPLGAQTISGTLVEAETGAPVEGAAVTLLGRDGRQLDWSLTNASGRFNFVAPGPGTYVLQADRIGHARVLSDPIPVDRGVTVVYRLEAPVEAIVLAGIDVGSSRRCEVRPGQGLATATVWEEARKALEVTSRSSGPSLYRYMIRRYERELDARGRRVRSEQSRLRRGQLLSTPFRSLSVEDLLGDGFVRPEALGGRYYAPNADVLLSDPFLDTHCMSLAEGEDEAEGLIGLSFEPTEDRGVTDISGVLWVDPADGELRWLDYRYEFLDVPNSERLGGKIRFHRLPNGTWIIGEWYILMPRIETTIEPGRRDRTRLVGIREEGGLVVRVNDLQGNLVLEPQGSGRVQDMPAVLDDGTGVMLLDDGAVQIASVADGAYSSRAFYPAEECAQDELPDGFGPPGILTGFVLHENGDPAPGVRISVSWVEVVQRRGLRWLPKLLTTTSLPDDGFFLICGLPRNHPVEISVMWNGIESRPEEYRLLETPHVSRQDITIPEGG